MYKPKVKPGTVLYAFHSKDHLQSGFLFGTMHVSDLTAFTFYELALEKMSTCELLATEIDLDVGASYDINALLSLDEGQSFHDYLRPKKYNKLKSIFLKSFNIDIDRFNTFLPLFLLNVITETELTQQGKSSLDITLWQNAIDLSIDRTGLENFNEHFDVLKHIDVDHQMQMLLKISRNISSFRKGVRTLSAHYSQGDLAKLFEITKKSLGKLRHVMLYDRNAVITSKINELSKESKVFAAMGASHLWGKKGIIALMKQKDFTLKPIY